MEQEGARMRKSGRLEWTEGTVTIRFWEPYDSQSTIDIKREGYSPIYMRKKDLADLKLLIDEFFREYPMEAEE